MLELREESGHLFQVCEGIELRLRDDNGALFHMCRLLPTFLHELAHVVRERERLLLESGDRHLKKNNRRPQPNVVKQLYQDDSRHRNEEEASFAHGATRGDKHSEAEPVRLRARKAKRLNKDHCAHDDGFYDAFKGLLISAEKRGIYSLPSTWKSKTAADLRRFDALDMTDCPLAFCGSSQRYPTGRLPQPSSGDATSITAAIRTGPQRLLVVDNRGVQKPVALEKVGDFAELLRLGAQKLRLKSKPTRIETLQGIAIDSEAALLDLPDYVIVKIS